MINRLNYISRLYRSPEPGDDGGGDIDRGDKFVATDEDPKDAKTRLQKDGKQSRDGEPGVKLDDEKDEKEKDEKDEKEKDDKDDPDEKDEKDEKDDKDDPDEKDEKEKKDEKSRTDGKTIPVSRHREMLKKERAAREALERQLASTQKGTQIANTNEAITKIENDIVALEAEYNQLLIEGKAKEASEKMRAIRTKDREVADMRSTMAHQATMAQAVEKVRYDTTVERLEEAYPQINPDSEEFDEELSADLIALTRTYVRDLNLTPAAAIQRAAKRLIPATTAKQEDATTRQARVSEEDAKKALAEKRKKEQVEKNLKTQQQQPADASKVGADSDRAGGVITAKDVVKLPYNDFAKLDEKVLARMRGDTIE